VLAGRFVGHVTPPPFRSNDGRTYAPTQSYAGGS
jgi:hypothetical protein